MTNTSSDIDDHSEYIQCDCGKRISLVSNSKLMGIAIEAHALEHTQTKSRLNQNEEVKKIEKLLIQQVIKKITAYSQP